MRNLNVQMSLFDTYTNVCSAMEENKPAFLQLLEEHVNFKELIPFEFYIAFYQRSGRPREYSLESFIKFFILQKTIGITKDSTLLALLSLSRELRQYCGFVKVPDASKITRFRKDFVPYLQSMFAKLVDITEPICRGIDPQKADYLVYDLTGVEAYVAENNPKFVNSKLNQARKSAKKNPDINPHFLAYSLLPESAKANPQVKQQYINGHFCYAHKAGILTNGLGVVRDIAFFDKEFKRRHPEVVSKKTKNPEMDKVVGDSVSLKPVLSDFFKAHPSFSYKTFLGDSSFDSYDNYKMLRYEFHFDRMAIPLNKRNSADNHGDFDVHGKPVCPVDKTPFTFIGFSGGKNRSERYKWVCHKSIPAGRTRVCSCEFPCTNSSYGRCVYTYPDKNLRLYPGIPRGTVHWDNLYRHRTLIERTIYMFKEPFGVASRKSFSASTAKADLLLAGITQLVGVILAHAINKPHLYKSIRKLIA